MKCTSITALVILLMMACEGPETKGLFSEFEGKKNVWLVLSNYGLDSIPPQIGELNDVKELKISADTTKRWIAVPPPGSWWIYRTEKPPFKFLPEELLHLKKLTSLELTYLDLKELPDGFEELSELTYLDLRLNKLDIQKELPKLKSLRKLRNLYITGNKLDTTEIKHWIKANPGLNITYQWDVN